MIIVIAMPYWYSVKDTSLTKILSTEGNKNTSTGLIKENSTTIFRDREIESKNVTLKF